MRRVHLLFLLLWVTGCGLAHVKPLTDSDPDFAQAEDENQLIERANAIDEDIRRAGIVLETPALQDYIDGVVKRVLPETIPQAARIRVRILHVPTINAMALPNGSVYVGLGLLSRLENEAQLAHVLAHEITHVVQRHALTRTRSDKAGRVAATAAEIATLGVGSIFVGVPVALSLTSFARSQEEEADKAGLVRVSKAGYDCGVGATVYDTIRRALPEWMAESSSIYATHPSLQARASYLRAMIDSGEVHPVPQARIAANEFIAMTTPLQAEYVNTLVATKQFQAAREWVTTAQQRSSTSTWIRCASGDAHLGAANDPEGAAFETAMRTNKRVTEELVAAARAQQKAEAESALADYEACAAINPRNASAQRGIGLANRSLGHMDKARSALQNYLRLRAKAADRRYVQALIASEDTR